MTYKEYCELENKPGAKKAEARLRGIVRGGYVTDDTFYTITPDGIVSAPLSAVRELRYAPYAA